MSQSDSSRRRILEDKSRYGQNYVEAFFERDVERILSTYIWAYETANALEDRITIMKAGFISLAVMGNDQNTVFEDTLDFYTKFVKSKINKQSIDSEKLRWVKGALGTV